MRGLEEVADAATRGPLLLLGNHTSWWDGLLAFHLLATELRLDATALMDANNLRRVPFLARIGGFGVELDDPRDVLRGLRHAASRLDAPGRVVVVFPQGRERPVTSRPLGFRPGAAHLARMAPAARVVSFALRYEMGADERATVHASFAVGDAGAAAAIAAESRVTSLLDALDAALCAEDVSAWRALWPRPARFPLPERVLAMLLRG